MTIAVTDFAWVGIVCVSVSPWLIIVERQTAIAGITISVVGTLTYRVDAGTTSTGVSIARASVEAEIIWTSILSNTTHLAATVISRML